MKGTKTMDLIAYKAARTRILARGVCRRQDIEDGLYAPAELREAGWVRNDVDHAWYSRERFPIEKAPVDNPGLLRTALEVAAALGPCAPGASTTFGRTLEASGALGGGIGAAIGEMLNAAARDGVAAVKDGRVITRAEMYLGGDSLTVISGDKPRPNGCMPATGAAIQSLHWIQSPILNKPVVWEWRGDHWYHDGVGDFASCVYGAGYHYLGPAEYVAPRTGEAVVTAEMIGAGVQCALDHPPATVEEDVELIYRAMNAVAPVELVSEGERLAVKERDEAYGYLRRVFEHFAPQCTPLPDLMGMCAQIDNVLAGAREDCSEAWREADSYLHQRDNALGCAAVETLRYNEARRELNSLRSDLAIKDSEITRLRERIASLPDAPVPDYLGPVADGRATPSIEHERFHESVKDVLAGKIMPTARRQMQEALKQAPKEAPTTASTSAPMPGKALAVVGDLRRMGP